VKAENPNWTLNHGYSATFKVIKAIIIIEEKKEGEPTSERERDREKQRERDRERECV